METNYYVEKNRDKKIDTEKKIRNFFPFTTIELNPPILTF